MTNTKIIRIGRILTLLFLLSFLSFCILSLKDTWLSAIELVVYSVIPFFLVSLLRYIVAAKRPYEKGESKTKHGQRDSFPSRHAYSAFFVATLAFHFSSLLSYLLFPFAVLLSALRVVAGYHYPKDVIAGAFLGVITAVITLIFL